MKMLAAISFLCLFAALPVRATVVSWNLDSNRTEGAAESKIHTFASPESLIAANGYTADWASHTPLALDCENHGVDQAALGIAEPTGHQWQENKYFSAHFDVGSILSEGLTNGKLHIGSIQSSTNEPFAVWGPASTGDSDVQTEGINNGSSDSVFANVGNFTNDKFISIGALGAAAMPVGFQATLTPVPEISAFFPIIGLIAAVVLTQILRRRRIAQLAPPPRARGR